MADAIDISVFCCSKVASDASSALISEIAEIRDTIKQSLTGVANQMQHAVTGDENKDLRKMVEDLAKQVAALDARVANLEGVPVNKEEQKVAAPAAKSKDDDDDFDLFGDDDDEDEEETEEEKAKRAALLKKYNDKKAKKPTIIAKSAIVLDVKPWDDETDMAEMERLVRTIQLDGLLWGGSKLVPLAYGVRKLQISCVVEDDKVGTIDLEEGITKFEDLVQSVDVAAFNKV